MLCPGAGRPLLRRPPYAPKWRERRPGSRKRMETVVLTIHLILALLLIGVVLLQKNEGGALLSGGGNMQARGQATALTKLTWGFATAFLITSMALTVIAARGGNDGSVVDGALTLPPATTPETPAIPTPAGGDLLPPAPADGPVVPPANDAAVPPAGDAAAPGAAPAEASDAAVPPAGTAPEAAPAEATPAAPQPTPAP